MLLKIPPYTLCKPRKIQKQSERSAIDVAYKIHGPKVSEARQHIIVLHGLLGSKRNWDSMSQKITKATNACVIAADARNHGDSPHISPHNYTELAADAAQLLNKLALKKAHFVGHSMGGRTAMTLALSEPSKVSSLVVGDISPISSASLASNTFFPILLKTMKKVNFHGADSLSKARQAAKDTIMAAGLVRDISHLGFVTMNIGELQDKTFGWKYNIDALGEDFKALAVFPQQLLTKQYPGPTLLVAGGRSDYVPKTEEPEIRQIFPLLELKYIDHVGHNVHAEDPNAFFNVIKPFYDKVLK